MAEKPYVSKDNLTQFMQEIAPLFGAPTDAQVETYINQWFTAHPDATTTVADGSITGAKLSTELNNMLSEFMVYPHPYTDAPDNYTFNGVTYTHNGDTVYANGTSGNIGSWYNLYHFYVPDGQIKAGTQIYLYQNSSAPSTRLKMQMFVKYQGASTFTQKFTTQNNDVQAVIIEDDVVEIIYRVYVPALTVVDDSIVVRFVTIPTNTKYFDIGSRYIPGYNVMTGQTTGETINLNNILNNSMYLCIDGVTYENKPTTGVGFLQTYLVGNFHLQIFYAFTPNKMWLRRGNANGSTWTAWQQLSSGSEGSVTNNYTFNTYEQTLTVNAAPQITADTNNYLASTGDTTDRTADILTMLQNNGVCRLGKGEYWINSLQMPNDTAIYGSGFDTRIYVGGDANVFGIKLGTRCIVKDFRITGKTSDVTLGETQGTRFGIIWEGQAAQSGSSPYSSVIDTIYVDRFSGSGLRFYNTGTGTFNMCEVSNIVANNCWAGIDIAYSSEFHKFTNVTCRECRIGCVNNGGNNVFVNCDFSRSKEIGFLMDNSQNQSPNNSHGSCIGCIFNHTQSGGNVNSGIGIQVLNCNNGYIFDGCQIFFSKIDIKNSAGVVISNTNFGRDNCNISIDGGGVVLFANNIHQAAPSNGTWINVANNENVHFVNCYNRSNGRIVEP